MSDGRQTMDFFDSQASAARRTTLLVVLFLTAVVLIVLAIYVAVIVALGLGGGKPLAEAALNPKLFMAIAGSTVLVIAGGTLFKINELRAGGSAVAFMLGGVPVALDTKEPNDRKLLNVVDEMSLASGCPPPSVFVMRKESGINAFAAGFSQTDAAIGVTQGAIELLDRDELQGVIAHEFSHIANGDMRLNIKLMGVLHGILLIGIAGMTLLRVTFISGDSGSRRRSSDDKNSGGFVVAIMALGVILTVIGYIGVFFGKVIKAAVSRQREFLADAAAVQYTRNPRGLAGALQKIGGLSGHARIASSHAEEASHMFFGEAVKSFFAMSTHPPLPRRIKAIDPTWDGSFPKVTAPAVGAAKMATGRRPMLGPDGFPMGPMPGMGGAGPMGPMGAMGPAMVLGSMAGGAFPRTHPPGRDANRAVESVGTITAEALEYAHNILESLPDSLRDRTRNTAEVTALVFALIMEGDADRRARERAFLQKAVTPALLEKIDSARAELDALDARYRLPLLELCIPALRALSDRDKEGFLNVFDQLVGADGAVSMFEFAAGCILQAAILSQPRRSVQFYSINAVGGEVLALVGALAWSGSDTPEQAAAAFAAGMTKLRTLSTGHARLGPRGNYGHAVMVPALERLAMSSPGIKRQVLEASAAAITADQSLRVEEVELLRAVAASLDCPMPPM